MSRKMAKKLKGLGKTLSEGSPMPHDGVLPSQSIPTAHPFWEWHPQLGQVASLANSGAWGVVIAGKFICSPSCSIPGLPQGAPCHQILFRRMPIHGNPFFLPDHTASLASQAPSPSIVSGRMLICGKCFPWIFPHSCHP